AAFTLPAAHTTNSAENVVHQAPGGDTAWHTRTDGRWQWRYRPDLSDSLNTYVEVQQNVSTWAFTLDGSTALADVYWIGTGTVGDTMLLLFTTTGTHTIAEMVLTDTATHTGDGLTWNFNALDPSAIDLTITDPTATAWDSSQDASS